MAIESQTAQIVTRLTDRIIDLEKKYDKLKERPNVDGRAPDESVTTAVSSKCRIEIFWTLTCLVGKTERGC